MTIKSLKNTWQHHIEKQWRPQRGAGWTIIRRPSKLKAFAEKHEYLYFIPTELVFSFFGQRDNNGVTGLQNSYPSVIAALKVLLELVKDLSLSYGTIGDLWMSR